MPKRSTVVLLSPVPSSGTCPLPLTTIGCPRPSVACGSTQVQSVRECSSLVPLWSAMLELAPSKAAPSPSLSGAPFGWLASPSWALPLTSAALP